MKHYWLACCATLAWLPMATPAEAQRPPSASAEAVDAQPGAAVQTASTTEDAGLDDIIVTAQRRSENLQRAALAISAISGNDLRNAGISRPSELTALVPSLQIANAYGPFNNFYLRGVGNYNGNALTDAAVAFNFDGVFVGRPSSTTGFFYDLERVEVVKGPQGTLYGRNATGGAINVISHKPELNDLNASLTAEYGNFDAVRLDGAINVPLGQNAAIRAAGLYVRHDGYLNDGTDDQKDYGGRLSLRLDPTETLKIAIVADYFHQGGTGTGSTPIALGVDNRLGVQSPEGRAYYSRQPNTLNGRTSVPLDYRAFQDNEYYGVSSTINWEVSAGTFTFVPAYREGHLSFLSVASGAFAYTREDDQQTSFEARFATRDDLPVRLLVGAFYYDERNEVPLAIFNQQSNRAYQTDTVADTQSLAAFGRLTWSITPEIRLTGGARYTTEDKTLAGRAFNTLRPCLRPTQYFPTYVPGCPNAVPLPFDLNPPTPPNFVPTPEGTITTLGVVDNTGSAKKRASFERPTYRLAADWDIADQSLLYGSFETGYKSGGFFFSNDLGIFEPERIRAFTIGSKNRFLDNRLQLNLEAFYWRYSNQQLSHLTVDSTGATQFATENVGQATFKGAELEGRFALFPATLLTVDVQYLDAKYNDFLYSQPNFNGGASNGTGCPNLGTPGVAYLVNCSGRRPPNAPEWTLNLGTQQTVRLANDARFVVDLRGHYQSRTLTGIEFRPEQFQDSYWLADASLTYHAPEDRYFVTAYMNNIFDETIIGSTYPPALTLFTVATLRPPRLYGIRAGVRF